jgi:sugar phosphate permease
MILGSQVAARRIGRTGAWPLIAGGASLSAAGAALLSTTDPTDTYAAGILPALVLSGLGFGLMFVSVVIVAMKGAQPQEAGVISGLTSTMQQVGGAVGVAVLISVATTGHGADTSLDPRTGFIVLATGLGLTVLTAITMWLRSPDVHRPA